MNMKLTHDVIVLGPPGSGKGTQARLLAKEFGARHYEQGQLLRDEIASGSDIGQKVQALMNSGKLVPGEIIEQVLEEYFKKQEINTPVVFDGVPRTMDQISFFERVMNHHNRGEQVILCFELSDEISERRLLGRVADYEGQGKEVRADDNSEVIKTRIKEYQTLTAPLLEHYKSYPHFISIDASMTIPEVDAAVRTALKPYIIAAK